jgi:hypothetical protein
VQAIAGEAAHADGDDVDASVRGQFDGPGKVEGVEDDDAVGSSVNKGFKRAAVLTTSAPRGSVESTAV